MFSLRLTASILSWLSSRLESDLLKSSSGKWQQQQRQRQHDKKTQLHPKDKPHTLTHPGYRVTSQKHWELSWMSHDCKDWSFQDTITGKLALFHSAALPINPFARRCKSWSVQRIRRVNLELKIKTSSSLAMHPDIRQNNPLQGWISSKNNSHSKRKFSKSFGPVVSGPWSWQAPLGPMLRWCVRHPYYYTPSDSVL